MVLQTDLRVGENDFRFAGLQQKIYFPTIVELYFDQPPGRGIEIKGANAGGRQGLPVVYQRL